MSGYSIPGRRLAGLVPILASVLLAGAAEASSVEQTNLISDGSVKAKVTNSIFINPWGITYAPGGDFWISSNGWGNSPIYKITGFDSGITLEGAPVVPLPPGAAGPFSAPTGQIFNGTDGFVVSESGKSGPGLFLYATEDGTLSGWNPTVDPSTAILAVDNSKAGAVYKGLALYTDKSGTYLLATNFHSGFVEVYDSTFTLVGEFRDHGLAADIAPFNVQVLGGKIYVTYAKQDAAKHDDQAGPGNGTVEIVDLYGTPVHRAHDIKVLNSAWGLAIAPSSWGSYAGDLLVGNFGDGHVNVYDPTNLEYVATLVTKTGKPLAIDGLWGLIPGNDGSGGSSKTIYFSAGPNKEADGLFGALTFKP